MSNLESYFNEALSLCLDVPSLDEATELVEDRMRIKIMSERVPISERTRDLNRNITHMNADIEENLRKSKVVEAVRRKMELLDKLDYVQSKLIDLKSKNTNR
jgi:hypothetical protein